MHTSRRLAFPLLLACLLPLAVPAQASATGGIRGEISAELDEARREMRHDLAEARAELERENLSLDDGLRFGKEKRRKADAPLPKAEITPQGGFLVEGREVAVDARQRRQLLAYRAEVIDIAKTGIDIGERTAEAVLTEVDRGLFRMMFSAMTGGLERRMQKSVRQMVEPGVRQICGRLPALFELQQQLSASLPEFRPYASLEADSIERCQEDVSREFASL